MVWKWKVEQPAKEGTSVRVRSASYRSRGYFHTALTEKWSRGFCLWADKGLFNQLYRFKFAIKKIHLKIGPHIRGNSHFFERKHVEWITCSIFSNCSWNGRWRWIREFPITSPSRLGKMMGVHLDKTSRLLDFAEHGTFFDHTVWKILPLQPRRPPRWPTFFTP